MGHQGDAYTCLNCGFRSKLPGMLTLSSRCGYCSSYLIVPEYAAPEGEFRPAPRQYVTKNGRALLYCVRGEKPDFGIIRKEKK